jgi:hypothetical protein
VPTHHPSPVVAPRGRPGWGWRSLRRIARDRIDVRVCPWAGGCGLETSRRVQGHHSARDSSGPEHHHCSPNEERMLPDGSLGPSAHRREPQPRWLLRRNAVSVCGHPTLLYAAEAASVTSRGHSGTLAQACAHRPTWRLRSSVVLSDRNEEAVW